MKHFAKPSIFIIVGPPGSGKETQANMLETYLLANNTSIKVVRHDNGNILRRMTRDMKYTDYMRNCIDNSISKKGETVPGAITMSVITQTILKKNDGKSHIIFEGILRNVEEIDLFDVLVRYCMPQNQIYFICLDASNETLKNRLMCRRTTNNLKRCDDKDNETIHNRLEVYRQKTTPVITAIKTHLNCLSFDINAELSKKEVHDEIIKKILKNF